MKMKIHLIIIENCKIGLQLKYNFLCGMYPNKKSLNFLKLRAIILSFLEQKNLVRFLGYAFQIFWVTLNTCFGEIQIKCSRFETLYITIKYA